MIETTLSDIENYINTNQFVVVNCFADWAEKYTNQMFPIIEKLEETHKEILFLRWNSEKDSDSGNPYNVQTIPSFLLFKNGKLFETIAGCREKDCLDERLSVLKAESMATNQEFVAHICVNNKIKPYPPLLCSYCCPPVPLNRYLTVVDLAKMLNDKM